MSRRPQFPGWVVVVVLLAGCAAVGGQSEATGPEAATPRASESAETQSAETGSVETGQPLRPGERRVTLRLAQPYQPSAPTGSGSDDYRCFLLDPRLDADAFLTGTNVLPDHAQLVHHVILFRVGPDQVAAARAKDASEPGPGWTCFGGSGLPGEFDDVTDANWLGAWAPGGQESVAPAGYGVELARGSQIVMQVHYNLLAGAEPDASAVQLRVAAPGSDLTGLHTVLLPAPVELPCRPEHDGSPLCDRATAVADVRQRFGLLAGSAADFLYFLCGGRPVAAQVTSCTRPMPRGMTILGVAGHMHLLGRSIRIEANPDTPQARTLLDIKVWDFDNQSLQVIEPVHLDAFDTVRVTCRHAQWLRDRLPAFADQPERYVVWGEGTTDEMCLGLLQVAFD